jgi:hypothetical protein
VGAVLTAEGGASVTVLANGGEVAWSDAGESVAAGRPVIVVDGSGRTADVLAAALRGEPADSRAAPLVASGLVHACTLEPASLEALVDRVAA